MRRFERPERLAARACGTTRSYLFDGGCVTYGSPSTGCRRRVALMFDADSALAFQPRAELVARGRATGPGCACAAPARRRAREDRAWPSLVLARVGVAVRVVVAVVIAIVTTSLSLRLLGMRRGWGDGALAGVVGWGIGRRPGPRPRRLGLGQPTASSLHARRHRHPGDDGGGRRARPAGPPRLAGDRRARRPGRRAAAAAGRAAADRRAPPLPGARAPRPARGLRAVPLRRRAASERTDRRHRRPPAAGARGGRRRLRQARPDRRHPRRPAAARGLRRSWPKLQNRVAAGAGRARSRPVLEAELGGTGRRGLRRVRLGAARRGVDRPDLPRPGCTRASPSSSRSSGPASRRSWSATSPRSRCSPSSPSGAPRSARACARARCSTSSRKSLRAELDFRREADAMDEMAALLGDRLAGAGPDGLPRAVHPPAARAGALRGLHRRRHRASSTASASTATALAEQLLRCDARPGAADRLLPRRSPPGQHLRLRRRDARPHRLRRRRPPRPDPAGGGRRHAGGARRSATSACCATASSGSPTSPRRCRPSSSSGRSPGSWPSTSAPTGAVDPTVLQDLVAMLGRLRHPPARRPRRAVARARHPRRHAAGALARAARWSPRRPS